MIVRVAIEGIESTLDLEGSSWTPELIGTFLRMCGDEVMRVCEGIGLKAELDGTLNGMLDDDDAEDADEGAEGSTDANES